MAINLSGLSGYALDWAKKFNETGDYGAADTAAQKIGGTSNTVAAPKNTTQNQNASNKQYYVPGQQSWEDAIAGLKYTPRDRGDMQSEAQTWADIQINPQKTALQTALQNAISSLGNQERTVNANYANLAANKDAAVDVASKRALESAISRGGGRSGVVEWATAENTKPIMTAYAQAEAQKTAELNNLASNRTLAQSNYDAGIQALEEQRGALAAAQLSALLNGDRDTAMQYQQMRVNAEQNLATLLNARDMYNTDAVRADTALTGVAGGGLQGTVSLKDYLEQNGGNTPTWDASTGNVGINGRTYTPKQLEEAGGYIQNGRWQIPESVVRGLL